MQNSCLLAPLRINILLFTIVFSSLVIAQENGGTIGNLSKPADQPIIEPEKKPSAVKAAQIDTEKFELGIGLGVINVEDFNSNLSSGLSFTYHVSDLIIAQANYGSSKVSQATFEELNASDFISDSDRNFRYFSLSGGYKVLKGRSFFGRNTKLNTDIYILAGLGQYDFADNSKTGLMLGGSYRTVLTDWLVMNMDIRDHIANRDFIGDSKTTHNTEFVVGLNALF